MKIKNGCIDSAIIRGQQDFEKCDQLNTIGVKIEDDTVIYTKKIQKSNV